MRIIAVTFAIAVLVGFGAKYIGAWSAGYTMLAILVGVPVAGLLITIDDDLPGGFSNPDGKTRPPWRYRQFWGEMAVRGALAGVGFAADLGWFTAAAVASWAVAVVGTGAGLMVMRHPMDAHS